MPDSTNTSRDRASTRSFPATGRAEGGDPACWAHRVCPQCGRLNEAEHPETCEACGADFPAH